MIKISIQKVEDGKFCGVIKIVTPIQEGTYILGEFYDPRLALEDAKKEIHGATLDSEEINKFLS